MLKAGCEAGGLEWKYVIGKNVECVNWDVELRRDESGRSEECRRQMRARNPQTWKVTAGG